MLILLLFIVIARLQETCMGKSDVLLMVDGSGSIACSQWCIFMDFCASLANSLKSTNVRLALTQFSGSSLGEIRREFDFTNNYTYIAAAIQYLKRGDCATTCPGEIGDYTPFGYAMDSANATFRNARPDVQKFMFFFSDGDPYPSGAYCQDNTCLRSRILGLFNDYGVITSAIRIGSSGSESRMKTVMSYIPCFYFYVPGFSAQYLNPLVSSIKSITCLDAFAITPSYGCTNATSVKILGAGFPMTVSHDPVSCTNCVDQCNLMTLCRVGTLIRVATLHNSTSLTCPITLATPGTYIGQVSIDMGKSWTVSVPQYESVNCANPPIPPIPNSCKSMSDIVFVLDSSLSITDADWSQLRTFVYNLTSLIYVDNDYAHIGVVEFTKNCGGKLAQSVFSLSGNRNDVILRTRNLNRCGRDSTPLDSGLKEAYSQLANFGRNSFKFVVLVTDGVSDSCLGLSSADCENSVCQTAMNSTCKNGTLQNPGCYAGKIPPCCQCDLSLVATLKNAGVQLFTVSVGRLSDSSYLKNYIATYPEYAASVNSYAELQSVTDLIISSTCIWLYDLSSSFLCGTQDNTITITGSGFVQSAVINVKISNGIEIIKATAYISNEKLSFVIGALPLDGTWTVSVSIGGVWSNPLFISYKAKCDEVKTLPKISPFLALGVLIILLILLALAVCVLLSLLLMSVKKKPAKTTKIELKVEEIQEMEPMPEPIPEPEPEPEPMQGKAEIKRSMYFIGGKAMSVDWGEKGMTWDSPFRGADMGMGEKYGANAKNKLYDEIQKRKLERRNKAINDTKTPEINRENKPIV